MAHLLRGRQGAEVLGVDGVDSVLGIAELVVVGIGKQSLWVWTLFAVMTAGLCGVRQ